MASACDPNCSETQFILAFLYQLSTDIGRRKMDGSYAATVIVVIFSITGQFVNASKFLILFKLIK